MEENQQKRRFADLTNTDIENKKLKVQAKNTTKSNNLAANMLREYLREKNLNENFEELSAEEIAELLEHFYLEARSKDGDLYKKKSLESLRYAINRHLILKSPPYNKQFDIITGPQFSMANEAYKAAQSEIKRAGKASVSHYPKIEDTDLVKLYHSVYLSPSTPTGLLNRVQMNIRLYFCRRANENMEHMTKNTFKIERYQSGKRYICKVIDELDKNHRSDSDIVSGHMPEDEDCADLCPVRIFEMYISKLNPSCNRLWFEMYISKLNPSCNRLWQYPRECFETNDDIWYQNRPIGRDALQKFMTKLSNSVPLSKVYTNHSVRVTGATLLGKFSFSPAQIMSVTGHKSVSALSVYQRVTDEEKMLMGTAIGYSTKEKALPLPPTTTRALPAAPVASTSALVPFTARAATASDLENQNLIPEYREFEECFGDFGSEEQYAMNTQTNLSIRKVPVYMNCTFNVTINHNH